MEKTTPYTSPQADGIDAHMGCMDRQPEALHTPGHILQADLPVEASRRIRDLQQDRGDRDQTFVPHTQGEDQVLSPVNRLPCHSAIDPEGCRSPEHRKQAPDHSQDDQHGKKQKKLTAGAQGNRQQQKNKGNRERESKLHGLTALREHWYSEGSSAGIVLSGFLSSWLPGKESSGEP